MRTEILKIIGGHYQTSYWVNRQKIEQFDLSSLLARKETTYFTSYLNPFSLTRQHTHRDHNKNDTGMVILGLWFT